MDVADDAGGQGSHPQYVCHPYLQRRTSAAMQWWFIAYYSFLDEFNEGPEFYVEDTTYITTYAPSELHEAITCANRAYKNSLFRGRRVWRKV